MDKLREISGRGLAVCDRYDAMRLIGQPNPFIIILSVTRSAKFSRALIREINETADAYTQAIRAAAGMTS